MNFEQSFLRQENREKFDPTVKVGTFSDIESTVNFYALEKTINNSWGNEQDEQLAQDIRSSLVEPDMELVSKFNNIRSLANDNDETLRWLAFATGKDEKARNCIIESVIKHKGFSEEQADNLFLEFQNIYKDIRDWANIDVSASDSIEQDIGLRQESLPELKNKINEAIDFFKVKDSVYKNIVYLPTNPLERKQSGYGINIADTYYISSERGNEINEVHEFLHSLINPMTEKINFSEEDERAILALCRNSQKEHYVYPKSIFTEEIIRTYRAGFSLEDKPGFQAFRRKILGVDKEILKEELDNKNINLNMDIEEFLNNDSIMREFYEKYNQNKLSERIWNFFADYQAHNPQSFEEYLLNNYKSILQMDNGSDLEK